MRLKKRSSTNIDEPTTLPLRKTFFSIAILITLVFSVYSNSLNSSWHFDDIPNITDNPNIHLEGLSWNSIRAALYSDQRNSNVLYRPISCLSFALNYYFGGLNVFGYHFVNILIHLFSSIFLFLFIYHTLNLPSLNGRYLSNSYSIAMLAAVLWAINPIQTQAVTYIVQRMASLAGMFYILCMYLYLKARTAEKIPRKQLYYLSCFISFLMAFASKENALMLPFSILLYEILIIQKDRDANILKKNQSVFIVLGVMLLFGTVYLYYRDISFLSFMGGYSIRQFTAIQRVLTESRIIIFYISLLLYPMPQRLSIAHSFPISDSLFDPISTFFSILFILGAVGFFIFKTRKYSLFSFSYLFFFLNHVIESTIYPLELIFEHRNYIPSMLFFLPISICLINILEKYSDKNAMKYFISAFTILFLIGLGHSTFMRNFVWETPESLWLDASEKAPDQFRIHLNLAAYYQDIDRIDKAISEYRKALNSPVIHRKNEIIKAYFNLGNLYRELKDYKKAESHFRKALEIKPDFSKALVNMASFYDDRGNRKLADEYLEKAFRADPGDPNINLNMGIYHLKAGRPEMAIRHLMVSMKDERLMKMVLLNLGIAYKQKGLLGKAAAYLTRAAAQDPYNLVPHLHLVEIYFETGHKARGLKEAEYIVNLMIKDEDIIHQIENYFRMDNQSEPLRPSPNIVIPMINEVCKTKSKHLNMFRKVLDDIPKQN